jgi:hypothetical protein
MSRDVTEITQKPKRRRWLIVMSVLVLVSLVSWWNWPRGDVRFVGKWRCHAVCPSLQVSTWTLSSNGTGIQIGKDGKRQRFSWVSEGDQLRTRGLFPGWIRLLLGVLPKSVGAFVWGFAPFEDGVYAIASFSGEECVLKSAGCVVMLRRLPE